MTAKRRWPAATDYVDAMQHPGHVFTRAELKNAQFDLDMFGIPDGATGSNAVVFRAVVGQRTTALRCFTSQAGLSRERYLALARHCQMEPTRARWMVPAGWFDDEVRVKGEQWPLVEMDWITGRPLDIYVDFLCRDSPAALHVLADKWREMLRDLGDARVAHGDLQQGNVLIDQASDLRLVDLDGAWVPGMDGLDPPEEAGHQAFRHPSRATSQAWGPWMDTFPGLVVLTSLKALAHRPELWGQYNNGDNLIFTDRDFVEAGLTPLWSDLAGIQDAELDNLVRTLRQCCEPSWRPTSTLASLLDAGASRTVFAVGFEPPHVEVVTRSLFDEPDLVDGLDWQVRVESAPVAAAGVSVASAPVAAGSGASSTAQQFSFASSLPPPPVAQQQHMHAPVANPVNIPAPTTSTPFVFAAPPGAAPPPRGRPAQGPPRMATSYKAWAIVAILVGLVLGLPALFMAQQAETALRRGDLERAAWLSHRAVRWAIGAIIAGVMFWFVVLPILVSSLQGP